MDMQLRRQLPRGAIWLVLCALLAVLLMMGGCSVGDPESMFPATGSAVSHNAAHDIGVTLHLPDLPDTLEALNISLAVGDIDVKQDAEADDEGVMSGADPLEPAEAEAAEPSEQPPTSDE